MTRFELFSLIPKFIISVKSIEEHEHYFSIYVRGCVFIDELDKLREYCNVSEVSYCPLNEAMEISCSYKNVEL